MCIKRDKEKESKDSFFDGRGYATIFLGEDKLFASLELFRQNKGVLPYFLC